MKTAISCKHSLNNVVLIMYKPSLTYLPPNFFLLNSSHILLVGNSITLKSFNEFYKQCKQQFLRFKVGLRKGDQPMIMQDYHGLKLRWKKRLHFLMVILNGWKVMNQALTSPSWRESLFEKVERNIFWNISISILMLTLKSIKMRETAINSLKTSFKRKHSTLN